VFYPATDCSITTNVTSRENTNTGAPKTTVTLVSKDVTVYPNPPANNTPVTATWPQSANVKNVVLINPMGQTEQTVYPQTNQAIFDTRKLVAGGVYTIRIYTEKEVVAKKILIEPVTR
jgi:hypothetical protein